MTTNHSANCCSLLAVRNRFLNPTLLGVALSGLTVIAPTGDVWAAESQAYYNYR